MGESPTGGTKFRVRYRVGSVPGCKPGALRDKGFNSSRTHFRGQGQIAGRLFRIQEQERASRSSPTFSGIRSDSGLPALEAGDGWCKSSIPDSSKILGEVNMPL